MPPTEEPAVVKFQAMKELSDAPEDVVLDYTPLSNGTPEGERRSMAVVIRKELYAAIQKMCAVANLKLAAVTPRPYAVAAGLGRAFAAHAVEPPENKADAVATLVLGSAGGEFTVVRNGEVTFTRDVPGPVATSEPMLLGDVRRNLTMYAGGTPGHPIQGLYIAESAGGWASRMRAALGLPVSSYDPLNGSVPDTPETLRGRFAGAVGLLAAKASSNAIPINFVTPRQPREAKDPKKARLVIAAAAVLLLLLGGGAFGYIMLSNADAKFTALEREKASLEESLKIMGPDAKRLDAARKWQSRRVNWLDELYDMTSRLPAKDSLHVSYFEGKAGPIDAKGNQPNGQGTMTLKVSSRDLDTILEIENAMHAQPKYYSGIIHSTGNFSRDDPSSKEYTVTANVNSRSPDKYTALPSFKPPSRKDYPPKYVPPAKSKTQANDPAEETPQPREKKDAVADDE